MELLITLVLGLFIITGALITFASKNNNKFINFSISLAFSVMLMLIFVDLIPHIKEHFFTPSSSLRGKIISIVFVIGGVVLLKILDFFIPEHEGNEKEELNHIGLISSIALVLHNLIEGVAVYTTVSNSLQSGLLMCLGIGLHNIPLGMVIASTFYQATNDKRKTWLLITGISLSTFVGGLTAAFLSDIFTNPVVFGLLLCVTLGMLIYITIFELLPKMVEMKNKKVTILGIITGILLISITMFI